MKISSFVVDKTVKAWIFIIWISVSHTIAVNQEISDAIEQINNTSSNNDTDLQDGSNSLFPFVIPQFGQPLNETGIKSLSKNSMASPEPTIKLKQALSTDATSKPDIKTISTILPKSSDAFTTLRVNQNSSAQPEVATQRKERSLPTTIKTTTTATTTTTTDVPTTTLITTTIAPPTTSIKGRETTTANKDTTLTIVTKLRSTESNSVQSHFTPSLNESSSLNPTVTPRQTASSSDMMSRSTSGSMSSSSGSLSSKSFSESTKQSVSNSSTNDTTHSEYVTATNSINNSTELYFNTTDQSRLTHTLAYNFQSPDSFWPIALALTISIPTIVVLAITIAVLYRRRIAKPRSLLSMYGEFS